jgi:hypothetical protein
MSGNQRFGMQDSALERIADYKPTSVGLSNGTIPAGGSCTLSVSVTGTTTGAKNNTAGAVSSNQGGTGAASNTATLTVSSPSLAFVPSSVSFGTVTLWGGTSQILTITNNTTLTVKFSKIALGSLENVTSKDLTYDGGCMSSLAPGKSCQIKLSLWPSMVGAVSAVLTLTDSASDSPQKVAITATVIAPKANVSPSSLSFGSETENDESAAKTVTLSNPGIGPLTISGVTITGSGAADFLVTSTLVAVRSRPAAVAVARSA